MKMIKRQGKKCQKAKSGQHPCLHWDYSEPRRTGLSPKVGGRAMQRNSNATLGLVMRELNYGRYVRACAKWDRWPWPILQRRQPPHNLERLKCKVPFPVAEIKAKYPEQTMKQPKWVKWNVGQTKTPKSNNWVVVALENKVLMDPRRGFQRINKLRFPETHIRTQEYFSVVQSVWTLGAGKYLF